MAGLYTLSCYNASMNDKSATYDLIVIGGGASGMMTAGRAAELGARVLVIEKNRQLGKKLSITGGGRCNVTNAELDVRAFLENYGDAKEFFFSPFSQFSAKDTLTFFEERGLPLVIEARKRAFPETQQATDVRDVLVRDLKKNDVEIRTNTKVTEVKKNEDGTFTVETKKGEPVTGTFLAIATGGLAAPETGSTGDGFYFLETLDHTINEPNPNIVPLTTDAKWVHKISGVTLSFMKISFIQDEKVKLKKTGKILFTHFGISGPLVLNSSSEVVKLLEEGPVTASIDMFPDTNEGELDRRIWNLFEKNKNKLVKNILSDILPKNMVVAVLSQEDINLIDRHVNEVTKDERKALVKKIKNLDFEITGTLGFDKAVIADGGVIPEEVDFKTMQSKLHPNLYLLGDILHVNRPSGGFSLQLCWTTGFVAGTDIAKRVNIKKQEQSS